jgi:hypothetical protein
MIKSELMLLLYGLTGYWKVKDRDSYVKYLKSISYADYSGLGFKYIAVYLGLRLRLYKIILPAFKLWLGFKSFRLSDVFKKRL